MNNNILDVQKIPIKMRNSDQVYVLECMELIHVTEKSTELLIFSRTTTFIYISKVRKNM